MTYCTKELIARGVPPNRVAFRAWRRARRLTLADVALLTGVCADSVMRFELGHTRRKHSRQCPARIEALMSTWDGERPKRAVRRRGRKPRAADGGMITGTQHL
jgi:transcriptional regulator with XRE-family HTH domain